MSFRHVHRGDGKLLGTRDIDRKRFVVIAFGPEIVLVLPENLYTFLAGELPNGEPSMKEPARGLPPGAVGEGKGRKGGNGRPDGAA